MPGPTLFPRDDAPELVPASDRDEPVLWLRRLVLLPDPRSDSPIRDIEFRRGLNIIQTGQRQPDEALIVGHSVGKSLLTRLIRYTLGEPHFAVPHVRTKIASELGSAVVIAHWRVKSQDWIIARPLQEARSTKSFAIKSDDWHVAAQDGYAHQPLADFLTAVNDAIFLGLSDFTLPKARRPPRWLDVLGWIARDHECGYRAPNEWRHTDADSGPSLDRDDSSVILQWMAGLMGSEETAMKRRHQELLDKRQTARATRDVNLKTIDVIGYNLSRKLELPSADVGPDDPGSMFAARVVESADEKITSFSRLKDERLEQSALDNLKRAEATANSQLVAATAEALALTRQISQIEARIGQIKTAGLVSPYARRSPFEDCPSGSCPLRLDNRNVPMEDPAKEQLLAILSEELDEYRVALPGMERIHDDAKEAHVLAVERLHRERARVSAETMGIDREIGRWQSYRDDALSFRDATVRLHDSDEAIESLDRKIVESNQNQDSVRQQLKSQRERLSDSYRYVLRDFFGSEAKGEIIIDGRGLHPSPDSRLAPNGAALSVMTSVLAFDISCVVASIIGIGNHPRLLIHDSPREGDMEEPLFHRLFEVAVHLESLFLDREPSFQYIVTTTSAPPPVLAGEDGPYVRLTLDARTPEGRLLRRMF